MSHQRRWRVCSRKSLSASLPRFGSQDGLLPDGTRSCRACHLETWWAYAFGHAFWKCKHAKFSPTVDVVITGIPASFRRPSRSRNLSEVGPQPLQLLGHGKRTRTESLSFLGARPPTRISRVEVALPTFPQGAFLSGAAMGGLGSPWRFLRRPDNTVTGGWGNMSPKAESEGGLVLVFIK